MLRPRDIVHSGAQLVLEAEQEAQGEWLAQDIELEIVYEDEHILVIDKPAGLVVHPAAGHQDGTLLNALFLPCPGHRQCAARRDRPPAGQGHDRPDGSGQDALEAHTKLVAQLQARSVSRIYEAIVIGVITSGGTIDAPIGRHGCSGSRRWRVVDAGKVAVSHYRVLERFRAHTHTRGQAGRPGVPPDPCMSHIGYPLVGDPVWSTVGASGFWWPARPWSRLREFSAGCSALPRTGSPGHRRGMKWESPLPEDFLVAQPVAPGIARRSSDDAWLDLDRPAPARVWAFAYHTEAAHEKR